MHTPCAVQLIPAKAGAGQPCDHRSLPTTRGLHPSMYGGDDSATLLISPKPPIPSFSTCPLVSSDMFSTNCSATTALFKVTLEAIHGEAPHSTY